MKNTALKEQVCWEKIGEPNNKPNNRILKIML